MEVFQGMMTYPNVAKPVIVEMETYSQMAKSVGTDQYGVDEITNHCMIVTGDHIGTHIDSWGHVNPTAPRAEASATSGSAGCAIRAASSGFRSPTGPSGRGRQLL